MCIRSVLAEGRAHRALLNLVMALDANHIATNAYTHTVVRMGKYHCIESDVAVRKMPGIPQLFVQVNRMCALDFC